LDLAQANPDDKRIGHSFGCGNSQITPTRRHSALRWRKSSMTRVEDERGSGVAGERMTRAATRATARNLNREPREIREQTTPIRWRQWPFDFEPRMNANEP